MNEAFEVSNPILNSPFGEPAEHWHIVDGEPPVRQSGRRPAHYWYRDPKARPDARGQQAPPTQIRLLMVNRIRERVAQWRKAGYAGATRTTIELLRWWRREGREQRLFFAQLEAAETIIFLTEGRPDLRQGIDVPRDEPSEEKKAAGITGFPRYACKMATGAGKTTVMGMLAAWSILNKLNDRSNQRYSDVVLVVCPNVTIRDRLAELDPERGEASLYRTRDLVPPHLLPRLSEGKVLVMNWHVFEPQGTSVGGQTARVNKSGVEVRTQEIIHIGAKTTTARGKRYLTEEGFRQQVALGLLVVRREISDAQGHLIRAEVESVRRVESDRALIQRVLGRQVGGKKNILVMNDEAHHAYRIRREEADEDEDELFGEDEEAEEFYKEATVWVEGLDKVQKVRGINFCVDLSATPYYLGRVGQAANRPFPWVVSDFGLIDAIESGLVKIPQLAIRDTTGAAIPGYFNIWRWIMPQLTTSERGGKQAAPKPEAILKYAHTPIVMLGGLWEQTFADWRENRAADPRPPVFIIVCKNTQLANVIHDWLAFGKAPAGIPPSRLEGFRNNGVIHSILVHSKVVRETDTGLAKNDETRWMRLTLDTVGRQAWPQDSVGRPLYPEDFVELSRRRHGTDDPPLHPPGRDVRCIVSVGMLTEGWDCNTVTHIVGLRPFISQLLCEQVVGRGLRRANYRDFDEEGKLREEVAQVFGVPFEIIPFKTNPTGPAPPPVKRWHVRAIPQKAKYEIRFPRVEGYTQAIRNRIALDWERVPPLTLLPGRIPPEVEMKALNVNNRGRPSLSGPGRSDEATLEAFRRRHRLQALVFDLAAALTRDYSAQKFCTVPAHVLFPQLLAICQRYLAEKVTAQVPARVQDAFLAPYYGWMVERLVEHLGGDQAAGDPPELPLYESSRSAGSSAEVDFWTSRDVREVTRCHLNYVVADTKFWEQTAAYYIDRSPTVRSWVKNSGLGFAIRYLDNDAVHDYVPDFLIRLENEAERYLILEVKGFDPKAEIKVAAAKRWVAAVNAEGSFGRWDYTIVRDPAEVPRKLLAAADAARWPGTS